MKKQIGKAILIAVIVMMAFFVVHSCRRHMARPGIELSWRGFVRDLAASEYDRAYQCMSQDYKRNHTEADFAQAWSNYHSQYLVTSNRDITAVYLGLLGPALGRSHVFVTSSHLYLPLPLEDGFMGIHADLVYENGRWMVDDFPFPVEGR